MRFDLNGVFHDDQDVVTHSSCCAIAGQRMLAEGVNPALIENGARFNGSPMGPLETLDSISLETAYHAANQQRADVESLPMLTTLIAKGSAMPS